jgi:hypothetical protein
VNLVDRKISNFLKIYDAIFLVAASSPFIVRIDLFDLLLSPLAKPRAKLQLRLLYVLMFAGARLFLLLMALVCKLAYFLMLERPYPLAKA